MYKKESYKIWASKNKAHLKKRRHEYYISHRDQEKSRAITWMKNNPEKWKTINKKALDKFYYGDDRNKILNSLGNSCVICGSVNDLNIHHIDNNGKNSTKEKRNNSPENVAVS